MDVLLRANSLKGRRGKTSLPEQDREDTRSLRSDSSWVGSRLRVLGEGDLGCVYQVRYKPSKQALQMGRACWGPNPNGRPRKALGVKVPSFRSPMFFVVLNSPRKKEMSHLRKQFLTQINYTTFLPCSARDYRG